MYYYETSDYRAVLEPKAYAGSIGPATYIDQAGEVGMVSEPAALLQEIYAAADPDRRTLLAPTLLRLLNPDNARVVARTLASTGNVGELRKVAHLGPAVNEL